MRTNFLILPIVIALRVHAQKVVVTNDDGWAVAQIRAQYNALKSGGFDVSLSSTIFLGLLEPLSV